MQNILTTNKLTKKVKGKDIVSEVNMHIPKGQIYGFLGPNGAGKTTTMKMLTNLWKPTSGEIILFGQKLMPDSYAVLKRMGSIIEFPTFYENLSAKENMKLHCEYMGYYSPNCVEQALDMLHLSNASDKKVKDFSLGMKQRLGIARAILTKPELLILDEPTNGLDPAGMKQIRDLLTMLCEEYGITILISSHLLSEIESIAHTIGVIHHGKMLKEISMKEISDMGLEYIELTTPNVKQAAYTMEEKINLHNFRIMEEHYIRIYDTKVSSQELSRVLADNHIAIEGLNMKSESLEDYFIKLTEGVQ
ncbi:ABC transporter ATP-binding protein [Anaeromicropila herbilytica]|uniref:Bacitracin ABC transporter ATP-binding protein n=1 Tax=Anaeromicropila herbilytica TaxID=2785025 RepID=A0A7R7EHW4_9FIRM|nr:ABC transporter ATP-binding protein [Anaeromicropila herbilytica]BCN29067.1 bacitracin ABC transporter ATP-binding protein [Anaeromicropila herbilytica]